MQSCVHCLLLFRQHFNMTVLAEKTVPYIFSLYFEAVYKNLGLQFMLRDESLNMITCLLYPSQKRYVST